LFFAQLQGVFFKDCSKPCCRSQDFEIVSFVVAIDINAVKFLLDAFDRGVSFRTVLTLGHLNLNVYPETLIRILHSRNIETSAVEELKNQDIQNIYADPLFRALGAEQIESLDASAYQGSSIVHDMNQPLPDNLKGRFEVVYDGGSLEHIFNFPVALRNCMEMVKTGGSCFIHTIANNCMGHGFYQFSPELFYRVFSESNGFEVNRMVMHIVGPYGKWFEVMDPEKVGERVELINFTPTMLLIHARRVSQRLILNSFPQQSDFRNQWSSKPKQADTKLEKTGRFRNWCAKRLPGLARVFHVLVTGVSFYRRFSLRNKNFYRRVPKR
jgi:hypothetical protein